MSSDSTTALLEPPIPLRSSPEPGPSGESEAGGGEALLEIRPATWAHAPAVIDIIRSSASWYEDIVEPRDLAEHYVDEAWARKNFDRRDFHVGVVEDEVVGTISLQPVGERFTYLGYVYLHVEHVGNGFGSDLLDFAKEKARSQGREGLALIAHPEADWACRAYRKYGFEVVAESRESVLAWENGWLKPYYEEGFQLFCYTL